MAGTDPIFATSIVDRKTGNVIQLEDIATKNYANGFVTGAATATTAITGTAKLASVGTGFAAGLTASGFTVSTSGRFTYTGTNAKVFTVDAKLTVASATEASQVYNFYIAKNGTIVAASKSPVTLAVGVATNVSVTGLVSLASTDYVEVWVSNAGTSDSATVSTMTIVVNE